MHDLAASMRSWAIVSDIRVWFVIALLGAAMLGRTGFYRSPWFRLLTPWNRRSHAREHEQSRGRNEPPQASPAERHPLRDPWFLAMVVIAAAAVVSWIVMSAIASNRALR